MLQVRVHGPRAGRRFDATDLRVLVVADVLLRTAELLGSLQVLVGPVAAGLPPGQAEAFGKAAGALGVHPFAAQVSPPGAEASLSGPVDVHVAREDAREDTVIGESGLLVAVGPAHADGDDLPPGPGMIADPDSDPLAVRLAMLTCAHHRPADLAPAVLDDARETLRRWRRRVSEWAEAPSRPVQAACAARALGALEDDLGTAAALAVLRELENEASVPAGARFETFAYLDRILGLELVRDIGRPRA